MRNHDDGQYSQRYGGKFHNVRRIGRPAFSAQRGYDRYENELELTESDWQACPIGSAEKIDGVFNPFYNAEEEDIVADDASVSGKALLVKLPNGVDRRTALSKLAVRCKVRMVLKDVDGAEIENSAQEITTDQTNISIDSALLQCALTLAYTENTNLTNAAPNLVYTAVPTVTNAPADSEVTYTYTWQYYDASGWFGGQWRDITYRNSPIKNVVISEGNVTFLLPDSIADRQKLDGLRVRCRVTASAGEYTIQNSPSAYYEFGTVAVDNDLLKYTLSVTSDNSGAEVDEASDILSFKVTPALSGAASSFNSYQYDWQYMDADGNWTSISRNDENCPLRTGMSFRCTSSAIATANHLSDVTPWGFISASTPEDAFTVLVNPKLLRSQASSTRRIVGFLTAEDAAKFIEDPESIDINTAERYDYTKSYLVKYFADGVREERVTADFPENIVAVYEYQVEKDIETVETKLGAVVIPVPWRFIVQNGKQYDLGSTKAQYRYDAVLAQIIPQWNAEELQKYIDEHLDPSALDYDEDDAVKWVIAAGLNGRFPHIKVCWNTELKALANHADYVKYNSLYGSSSNEEEKEKVAELAGSPNNPYWKQTYSDWFFKSDNEFTGDIPSAAQRAEGNNEASAEAQQLAWLNEHYGSVKVLMDDVRSEESDPTPIVVELPITWTKYTVDEYDAASQSMTARWLGNEAVANMQGLRAPAAKWVWHATIDAVEDGQYVLADALRYTDIEANIYWSRVIDSIVGALINENDTATTSFVALSNAAQLNGKIPAALRVELKDANGGLNITDTIPIDHSNWKLIEGSVYDAAQQYHWRALNANASSVVDEVGTGSPAGYVAIEPTLTGYTFTENADTEMARVWYQWGTIITGLKKDGGADFDAITAAKTPIIRIPTIGGTDQTAVTWNKLLAKINKSFGVTLLDKSSATGFKPGNITPTWVQPTYDATAPAGRIQPAAQFEKPASGIVFSEDLVRDIRQYKLY